MIARLIVSIICGILFGIGLVVSDMVNPERVLAFLDVTGSWDASLAFVMLAALVPSALAYRFRRHQSRPVFDDRFHIPTSASVDARLVLGAAMFGTGWGLVGLCPGPALAGLATGRWEVVLFATAMLAGMLGYKLTLLGARSGSLPSEVGR
ncbi:DUF6691 family protein [Rhizobium cauense]|uniref:DUF6691 family protein n=1 Tax=Rhizobium cauense TaxID=1166683 RepID=UPI001CB77390|nr:DUF6691 family protein [Rhizobium cauense]